MASLTFWGVVGAVVLGNSISRAIDNFMQFQVGPWLNKKAEAYRLNEKYRREAEIRAQAEIRADLERQGIDTLDRDSNNA